MIMRPIRRFALRLVGRTVFEYELCHLPVAVLFATISFQRCCQKKTPPLRILLAPPLRRLHHVRGKYTLVTTTTAIATVTVSIPQLTITPLAPQVLLLQQQQQQQQQQRQLLALPTAIYAPPLAWTGDLLLLACLTIVFYCGKSMCVPFALRLPVAEKKIWRVTTCVTLSATFTR